MSSGYYLTPAFYYFNLGAHTLYILRNRLQAQNVKKAKQIKILQDICQAIFKQNFIQSLLVPQDPFNVATLKDIFSRLVHSSIMKLDQASMDKLFYLILMSVKKQLFVISSPYQLYTLTLSHLLNLVKYLSQTAAVENLSYTIQQFQKVCSGYSFIQYIQIRQYMLSQLQTYQTKIVNFIENDSQTANGKLIYKARNGHNQKTIGNSCNQKQIEFNKENNQKLNQLFYNDWKTWKTSLVVDFVKQYKIASEKRHSSSNNNTNTAHKHQQKTTKQKTLKDTLNINSSDLNQFQVTFDLFQKDNHTNFDNEDLLQSLNNNKKIQTKNNTTVKTNNNTFKSKIQKEFSDIKLESKDQDQQPDLLEMMDS